MHYKKLENQGKQHTHTLTLFLSPEITTVIPHRHFSMHIYVHILFFFNQNYMFCNLHFPMNNFQLCVSLEFISFNSLSIFGPQMSFKASLFKLVSNWGLWTASGGNFLLVSPPGTASHWRHRPAAGTSSHLLAVCWASVSAPGFPIGIYRLDRFKFFIFG